MQSTTYLIRDMETLRIMADSMRAQILEMLVKGPASAGQLAARLGIQTSKMYYHLGLMEKHGLIEVVETAQVGNLIEKIYRAVAQDFDIDPALINFRTRQGKDNMTILVDSALDAAKIDVRRSLDARYKELENGAPEEQRKVILLRTMSMISEAHAQEFFARLQTLVEEFRNLDVESAEDPQRQMYSLTVVFNPTFYFPEEEEKGGEG